jgi:hypothetical protein
VLQSLETKLPFNFGAIMDKLQLRPAILQQVREAVRTLPENSVGLHIRRRDTVNLAKSLGKKLPSLQEYQDFAGDHPIILCTDDEDVVEIMKPNVNLSDPCSERTVITAHGSRKDSGVHIVKNALILACCSRFMGTPTSSVSEMIELWRKGELCKSMT